jgi:hypothetical protein
MTGTSLRKCLRIIRDVRTFPSDILPNGDTAENTAHRYVLQGNEKRNLQKRKRENPNCEKKTMNKKKIS